jgi:uncharacterized protein (TIGR02300 family)
VAKSEWGTKRTCQSCSARFYDMRRDPVMCPVCSAVHDPERQPRPRRSSPVIKDEPTLPPLIIVGEVARQSLDDDVIETDAGDVGLQELSEPAPDDTSEDAISSEERELMEDTSELGEDDDDIGEVMEHVDEEMDDKV